MDYLTKSKIKVAIAKRKQISSMPTPGHGPANPYASLSPTQNKEKSCESV